MPAEPFRFRFLIAWQSYERIVGRKVDRTELAKALGVSRPLVTAWESADEPPPHDRVLAIAKLAGLDPGWLAYGSDSGAPTPATSAPAVTKRKRSAPIADPGSEASRAAKGKRAS